MLLSKEPCRFSDIRNINLKTIKPTDMSELPVLIRLLKKQIVNDVSIECNIIGRTLQRNPETEEQGGDIMSPDDELTKPVVARAITEGFGEVKRICQRYLIMGRDTDDNRLERINEMNKHTETVSNKTGGYDLIAGTPYIIKVEADSPVTLVSVTGKAIAAMSGKGTVEYTPASSGRITLETDAQEVKISYFHGDFGTLELELSMPGTFNLGVTETAKSCAHRMIVDHVMHSLLLNQYPEKSAMYKERFLSDLEGLRNALQARTRFGRNAPDWS